MLSSGIEFFQYEWHPIFDSVTGKRINKSEDIVIGDHVWIALIVKVVVSKKLKTFVVLHSSCLSGSTMTRISCK